MVRTHLKGLLVALLAAILLSAACSETESSGGAASAVVVRQALANVALCTGSNSLFLDYAFLGVAVPLYDSSPTFEEVLERLSCAAEATTCNAVFGCVGLDVNSPCDPETFQPACDGNVAVRCVLTVEGGLIQRGDCAAQGLNGQCFVSPYDEVTCGAKTCEDSFDTFAWCDGDIYEQCRDGVLTRTDCQELGLHCIEASDDENGVYGCATGRECEQDYCDGDIAVGCQLGLEVERVDCSWHSPSLTCVLETDEYEGTPSAQCAVPQGQETCGQGEEDDERCVGDLAEFCIGGTWVSFDCGQIAGGTCLPNADDGWFEDSIKCTLVP